MDADAIIAESVALNLLAKGSYQFPHRFRKSVSSRRPAQKRYLGAGKEVSKMLPKGAAKKVTIYLNQDTRSHLDTLWSAILAFLRHKHVAGATLVRADAGFGSHEQLSNPQSEYVSQHSGVRIEFIETSVRVDELLPTLYDMVTDGLIAVQDVTVVKSVAKDSKAKRTEPEAPKKIVNTVAKLVRIYLGESDQRDGEPLMKLSSKSCECWIFREPPFTEEC